MSSLYFTLWSVNTKNVYILGFATAIDFKSESKVPHKNSNQLQTIWIGWITGVVFTNQKIVGLGAAWTAFKPKVKRKKKIKITD